MLGYAKENNTWAQPWYYPRKPIGCKVETLYLEHTDGNLIDVIEPVILSPLKHLSPKINRFKPGEISVIDVFNAQHNITDELAYYGYKCLLKTAAYEKWLSPDSTSGKPGIIVSDGTFFSFHNDEFNDQRRHDCFDLMRVREGLTEHDAIIKAAQHTLAPDGSTIDEYNKNQHRAAKESKSKKIDKNEPETDSGMALENVEPYHEPIDPNQLLLEIEGLIRRFIVCNEETIIATVLWIAMTWFMDVIQVAPLAVITAPEKRCGKSQLLFLLGRLVKRPLPASNISPAALFRAIDKWSPTILIDEADTFMKDNEELRGILNCGHTRDSAFIVRVVGKDHQPYKFNAWGAKALAGIGHLPSTIMDRAITLELRRKLPHEHVERLRHVGGGVFQVLQSKLARFAVDYKNIIFNSRPMLPEVLHDREQDNWEGLFAIADVASIEWTARARSASLKIADIDSSTTSIGTELLLGIQEIFEQKRVDRITSADMIQALCSDDEQPWATYNRGKEISPRQIASRLKEYGIKSKSIRIGGSTPKGFELSQFKEAFERYLVPTPLTENNRNTQQVNNNNDYRVADTQYVAATSILSATEKSTATLDCCGVADKSEVGKEVIQVIEL